MKDWTREILIQKYGAPKSTHAPATFEAAPTQEPQPQNIYKAADEFPVIDEYESIGDWLKALAAATRGWPDEIREAVVAEQLEKHRRLEV